MNYTSLDAWQETLYPLGLISTVFFGIRFFIQLWVSEKRGRSVVTNSFWHCSILGNATLALHAAIQLQLPVAILQGLQLVLAKRNLEIASPKKPPLFIASVHPNPPHSWGSFDCFLCFFRPRTGMDESSGHSMV